MALHPSGWEPLFYTEHYINIIYYYIIINIILTAERGCFQLLHLVGSVFVTITEIISLCKLPGAPNQNFLLEFFLLASLIVFCLSPGATGSVTKYFQQSQAAEARANASTIDTGSLVDTSVALRNLTEDKLNQTTEEFLQRHSEHAQRLDMLAGELQTLDLSGISHKVGE